MNFIWDIVLQAEAEGMRKEDLFFKQADVFSPYCEPAFSVINQETVENPLVEINALYRFSHLIQELLHPDVLRGLRYDDVAYFVYYFFDALMHYVSEIDLRHGLNRREFYVRKLRQELLGGDFGAVAAAGMAVMDRALQLKMANEVLTGIETGSSLAGFRRALRVAFPDSLLYQSNFDFSQLFLYIGQAETDERKKQVAFVLEGFMPLGFYVELFWQHHFGILGVDATMPVDGIAIF